MAKVGEPCQGGNAAALSHKLLGVSVFPSKLNKVIIILSIWRDVSKVSTDTEADREGINETPF